MTDRRIDTAVREDPIVAAFMDRLRTAPLCLAADAGCGRSVAEGPAHQAMGCATQGAAATRCHEPLELAAGVMAAGLLLAWSLPSAFEWIPRLIF